MGLQDGKIYVVRNVKAPTVLDFDYQNPQKPVHGWEYHNQPNQQWIAKDHGDGWSFQNLRGGYLAVGSPNLKDGLNITASENDSTRWYVKQDEYERQHGHDVYRLVVKNSHFSLDLADHGNPKNGTPVTLWGSWKGENQIWRFEQLG